MKYTLAIAALLGLAQSFKLAPLGHEGRLQVLNEMIFLSLQNVDPIETASPDDAEPDSDDDGRLIQTRGDYGEIPASFSGTEADGGYKRVVPARFDKEMDDQLMESMIKNYAREIKKDGELTGIMMLNKDDARRASNEVLATHAENNANGGNTFEEVWNHFDVNHDGLVEADRMSQFMRMLLGNSLAIGLQ